MPTAPAPKNLITHANAISTPSSATRLLTKFDFAIAESESFKKIRKAIGRIMRLHHFESAALKSFRNCSLCKVGIKKGQKNAKTPSRFRAINGRYRVRNIIFNLPELPARHLRSTTSDSGKVSQRSARMLVN